MVVDDRIGFLGLLDGALELAECIRITPLLEIRPAEAVDEVAVLGLELERLADELHRLVEILALLGVHVSDEVVGLGVLRIEDDDAAEELDGVVELLLLLVDDAELEDQILLLLVQGQAFLQRLDGAVVLLGAEVGAPQIEEELGPPRLDVDRLAEHGRSHIFCS